MLQRYSLRDDQWERIKDLLPGRSDTVGVTAKDNRLFVNAVIYCYRAGIPGVTYRHGLETGALCVHNLAVGPNAEFGNKFSNTWLKMPIMNTP